MRKKFSAVCLISAVIGTAALILGVFLEPRRFFFSYLTAWVFFLTIAVGALLLVMVGHASKARWFGALRRISEVPAATLPLFLLLVVPLFFGLPELYAWADPSRIADEEARKLVEHKASWMNPPFFIVRSLVWLAVFSGFSVPLVLGSLAQDEGYEEKRKTRLRRLSSAGLVVIGFVLTWASFDWLMSLDPTWYSTIFGVYVFAGGFAAALAVLGILSSLFLSREILPSQSATERQSAVGRLLLTFVIFWAYQGFSQLLVIWIGNLPHEIGFYQRRSGTGWGWVSFALVISHFLVPFLFLLSRDLKRRPAAMAAISIWILAAHYVDMYWLVMPNLTPGGVIVHWLDLAALIALFGVLGIYCLLRFAGRSMIARTDPYFEQSLRYESWP